MAHKATPVVRSVSSVPPVTVERTRGTTIQVMLGPTDGTPNFVTRHFTMAPGGRIPSHRHDTIEHEQLILEGTIAIGLDDREVEVSVGDFVFIPAGVAHWYENRGEAPARFACVVPHTANYQTEWLEPSLT